MKRCNLDKKSSEEILDILRNYRLRLEKDVLQQNPNDQQHSKEIKETRPVSVKYILAALVMRLPKLL